MIKAVFPGSFDPPTFGHLNIIERAASLFDELTVVAAVNPEKKYLFRAEERFNLLSALVKPWPNVSAVLCDTLIVDFMKARGIRLLLRGVRGPADFSYEFDLAMKNKALSSGIETIFMTIDPAYLGVSSSLVREAASFHGDISALAPSLVTEALKTKFSS